MPTQLTLGSLFDGSGGFPLAGIRAGIRPVWASEVEPFPILITTKNLPQVKHLGDVCNINGAEITPVDVITFGSPCQDLSVAGKKAGLDGARSGLFFEAIRIISEMKEATNGEYPKYALWENVPGAFSSNQGKDFATVLTNLIRLGCETAPDLPVPNKGWEPAGLVMAGGCSVAWRVLDAQFFGVAQRRRRIYAIADLGGGCAGEILFEPKGMPGDSQSGGAQEEDDAAGVENRAGNGSEIAGRRVFALNSVYSATPPGGTHVYEATVSKTLDLQGASPVCNQGGMVILEPQIDESAIYTPSRGDQFLSVTGQALTLTASDSKAPPVIAGATLAPRKLTPVECGRLQGFPDEWGQNLAITEPTGEQMEFWLAVWKHWDQLRGMRPKSARQVRLWLAKQPTGRALYKLWGNGIALPVAVHVLKRLVSVVEKGK